MFGFRKRAQIFGGKSKNQQMLATMKDAVDQQQRVAPFEANIRTGRLLADLILDSVADEPKFANDTALCVVGAMAGHAAAVSAAQSVANTSPEAIFEGDYTISTGPNGSRRITGTIVNDALISGPKAFWRLVDAKGRAMSGASITGLAEINSHVDATMHSPDFGTPRMPGTTRCLENPAALVDALWPEFFSSLTAFDPDPAGWCASWGFAAQDILDEACQSIPCADAMRVILECAVPMSRRDPGELSVMQEAA